MWMTRVAIQNPVFATMVMVALCVLGVFSYSKLGVEQMPDVTPTGRVHVGRIPGASPGAVETEITKPLEDAFNGIAGVKMIRSNSWEGLSQTVVEFNVDTDMTRATQDVRDKVAVTQAGFNRDVKPPFVTRFDGENAQPTVVLALLGTGRSDRELSLIADQTVQKRLTSVEGVARVQSLGLATRQVRIDLDPQRLRQFGLTPADVSTAIAKTNSDQPVGLVTRARTRTPWCASRAACATRRSSPTSSSRATPAAAWCCWAISASSSSASRRRTRSRA